MKTLIRNISPRLFALLAVFSLLFAPGGAHAQGAYAFSQQELDQMLAPIALYPDPLLSQILMAATHPPEVAEAARWSRARPGLSGDDAVRAAEDEDWDASVKSLLAFPQLLAQMGENPQWTQALGDAFIGQQAGVMDTVQALRRRAAAAGNLRSDDRLNVLQDGPNLLLQPRDPLVVYIPYYDPQTIYGTWWWPTYKPMYFRPWSGYYARPAYTGGYYWGQPVGISAGFFFGVFDWSRRQIRVAPVNKHYYIHAPALNRAAVANRAPGAWRHEPERRTSVFHGGMAAPQRFNAANTVQSEVDRAKPGGPRFDQHRDSRSIAPPSAPAPPAARAKLAAPVARTLTPGQPAPALGAAAAAAPAPIAQPAPLARVDRQSAGQVPSKTFDKSHHPRTAQPRQ